MNASKPSAFVAYTGRDKKLSQIVFYGIGEANSVDACLTSYQMAGEVAHIARGLGPNLGLLADILIGKRIKALKAISTSDVPDVSDWTPASGSLDTLTTLISQVEGIFRPASAVTNVLPQVSLPYNPIKWATMPVALHSQSLMVIDLFSKAENHYKWWSIGDERFVALFNTEIAETLGVDEFGGYAGAAEKMMIAIAYSALDGSERLVFDNTGIRVMYDGLSKSRGVKLRRSADNIVTKPDRSWKHAA